MPSINAYLAGFTKTLFSTLALNADWHVIHLNRNLSYSNNSTANPGVWATSTYLAGLMMAAKNIHASKV